MEVMNVGEFKEQFSAVLQVIRQGKSVSVAFGKNKQQLAVLVPYANYKQANKTKLGILKNKASFKVASDFKMSEEQFLQA